MLTASDPTDGSTVLTVSTLLLTLLLVALIFERVVHFFGPFWRQSIRMLHSRYATLGPPDLTHDDPEQQLNTTSHLENVRLGDFDCWFDANSTSPPLALKFCNHCKSSTYVANEAK
jgi:hypothetical protein